MRTLPSLFLIALLCSSAAADLDGYYCGQALGTSAKLYASSSSSNFQLNIYGSSPCQVSGTFTLSGSTIDFQASSSTCGSSFTVSTATYDSSLDQVYLTGSSSAGSWSGTMSSGGCADVTPAPAVPTPSGTYCGQALGTSAQLYVSSPSFQLNIYGSDPCQVSGSFTMSGSSVSFQVSSSTCGSSFTVSTATYDSSLDQVYLAGSSSAGTWSGTMSNSGSSCSASSDGSSPDSSSNGGAIAGGVIGALVAVGAVAGGVAFYVLKVRPQRAAATPSTTSTNYQPMSEPLSKV